jgi:membrane protein YqaA with SNARE-associated domain
MGFVGQLQTIAIRYWLLFKTLVTQGKAVPYLAVLSFAESFLIAIPVDPFLAAMIIADRTRWVYLAAVATVASTIGAGVGYLIGFFAFDYFGGWFFSLTASSDILTKIVYAFGDHAIVLTFAAALTPLPNGPVVVAAGFVGTNFFTFFLAWTIARAIRFFGVGYIVYAYGADTFSKSERVLSISTVLCALVVLGWFAYHAAGI